MKFIRFKDVINRRTELRMINVANIGEISTPWLYITKDDDYAAEAHQSLCITGTGMEFIRVRLKSDQLSVGTKLMKEIADFLGDDRTILDITEYLYQKR